MEDYFQGRALRDAVDRRHWARFEAHVERNTLAALELIERAGARATFFIGGWIGGRNPGLVREIVQRGHEVASAGMSGRSFLSLTPEELGEEASRSREILEAASGRSVLGYRVADHRMGVREVSALSILAKQGYRYDSSFHPYLRAFRRQPWRTAIHRQRCDKTWIWEVPLSSAKFMGLSIPSAGGNWFRQLPEWFVRWSVGHWGTDDGPFVMYFRAWDLDSDQPVIASASPLARMRHYRNQDRAQALIEAFLRSGRFGGIAEYLDLRSEPVAAASLKKASVVTEIGHRFREPVTVVIPCYNEEPALPYLANTLDSMERNGRYAFRFVLVDDGSKDGTADALDRLFGSRPNCDVVRHERNLGVAAAILTGIRAARTEVVCSMDCDCTYDPHELANMIPLLEDGVDLVTASPYHPDGHVLRVPGWRLALSRVASGMYRLVLRQRLYTYTSCFRVYRQAVAASIDVRERGFLGVAEMLGRIDLEGRRIVEYPATLQVRMLGRSKMRVLRTIAGHLRLMCRFAFERVAGRFTEGSYRRYASPALERPLAASNSEGRRLRIERNES